MSFLFWLIYLEDFLRLFFDIPPFPKDLSEVVFDVMFLDGVLSLRLGTDLNRSLLEHELLPPQVNFSPNVLGKVLIEYLGSLSHISEQRIWALRHLMVPHKTLS